MFHPDKSYLTQESIDYSSQIAQIALQNKYGIFNSHRESQNITSTVWDLHKKLTKKQQKQKPVHLVRWNHNALELDTMGEIKSHWKETTADSEWIEVSCDQIDHHQFWWKVHGQIITRKRTNHSAQRNIAKKFKKTIIIPDGKYIVKFYSQSKKSERLLS